MWAALSFRNSRPLGTALFDIGEIKNMDKIQEMGELLDLKRKIAYFGFDRLNLKSLEPLRYEVQHRIDKLIAESPSNDGK